MRKIKNVKIGEVVLVTKYSDKDFNDPWRIDEITECGTCKNGNYYRVKGSQRFWRHCWKITPKESHEIINQNKHRDIIKKKQ